MSRLQTIRDELDADPLVRGYSGMTDQQAADSLMIENRPQTIAPTGAAILDEIRKGAWPAAQEDRDFLIALSATGQQAVQDAGQIKSKLTSGNPNQIVWGSPGDTATIAGINALFSELISRAREIGAGGRVDAGDVAGARAL